MSKFRNRIFKITVSVLSLAMAFSAPFALTACNTTQSGEEQGVVAPRPEPTPVDPAPITPTPETPTPEDPIPEDPEDPVDPADPEDPNPDTSEPETPNPEPSTPDNPPTDETDEYANAYQGIIDALAGRRDTSSKILTIYLNDEGYLSFVERTSQGVKFVTTDVEIGNAFEDVNSASGNIIAQIKNTGFYKIDEYDAGLYTSDNEDADNAKMVTDMLDKLVGGDYHLIYGTVSSTSSGGIGYDLFRVHAIYEKGGKIISYENTINAANDVYPTPYEVVFRGNTDLYTQKVTETDLGEVAYDYYQECQKAANVATE